MIAISQLITIRFFSRIGVYQRWGLGERALTFSEGGVGQCCLSGALNGLKQFQSCFEIVSFQFRFSFILTARTVLRGESVCILETSRQQRIGERSRAVGLYSTKCGFVPYLRRKTSSNDDDEVAVNLRAWTKESVRTEAKPYRVRQKSSPPSPAPEIFFAVLHRLHITATNSPDVLMKI